MQCHQQACNQDFEGRFQPKVKRGEASKQFRYFTTPKNEYIIFEIFCSYFGVEVAKIFNKQKEVFT